MEAFMKNLIIRNETENDYATVEEMTREAFWNLYVPGCDEHYLVHIMRSHEDFIPELDYVAESDGKIVGNIMYTKARLIDEAGNEKSILTFGPLCVRPGYQRKGIGKELLRVSFDKALAMGCDTVVIFGNPSNYVARGFKSCIRFNVCVEGEVFPSAMMVKELKPDLFDGRRWFYRESPVYHLDQNLVEEYDKRFPSKEKKHQPHQEEFFIHSHSMLTSDSTSL
jgi:putative acetyltransferase